MKAAFQLALLLVFSVSTALTAQRPTPTSDQTTEPTDPNVITLPGTDNQPDPSEDQFLAPTNDIVEKRMVVERKILDYEDVREADIMWQKRVWRVLDVREKINMPFGNPQRPLISIFMDAAERGDLQLYDTGDDKFSNPLADSDMNALGGGVDTVEQVDADFNVTYVEVEKVFDPSTVRRYRIQEIWFFDKESSTMNVRILGIAPLKDQFDEMGNFLYELPMFWVYYPGARQLLANEQAYVVGNDAAVRSWEDVFEARYFNSYIIQESNVLDRRIDGYLTSGRERLLEAERIKQEIFNFEQDLWSY